MNEEIKFPIQTIRDGNKITKICVEDYYKLLNRIRDAREREIELWNDLWESLDVKVENANGELGKGCLIVGTGVSQPNIKDTFDEKIGNNIAFMKAKLNANFKKRNVLFKFYNIAMITIASLDEEIEKLDSLIKMDLHGLRQHNPEYLDYLDDLGYKIPIPDGDNI